MSNNISEKPTSTALEFEAQRHESDHHVGEKGGYDKSGAIDAENIEHDMTVMQAVKAYPAASWWAFVMSSTIVSSPVVLVRYSSSNVTTRLWSRTASS
jgi:SP family general alpha glucoside:H+ symporter-like MFS transporter